MWSVMLTAAAIATTTVAATSSPSSPPPSSHFDRPFPPRNQNKVSCDATTATSPSPTLVTPPPELQPLVENATHNSPHKHKHKHKTTIRKSSSTKPSNKPTTHKRHSSSKFNSTNTLIQGKPVRKSWRFLRGIKKRLGKVSQTTWNFIKVSWRAAEISIILSPLFVLGPLTWTVATLEQAWVKLSLQKQETSHNHDSNTTPPNHTTTPTTTIENHPLLISHFLQESTWTYTLHYALPWLGPCFVKLGQWAATRRDLFPLSVCQRLGGTLHASNALHSWKHSDKILQQDFGPHYSQKLKIRKANQSVVGSGCVAQVYKGVAWQEEEKEWKNVAIKVLHPRMKERMERDVKWIKACAALVDGMVKREWVQCMNLTRLVENFEDMIQRQVDLRLEAANLRQFHANFAASQQKHNRNHAKDGGVKVVFPAPVKGWVSERVLVEDLITDTSSSSDGGCGGTFVHQEESWQETVQQATSQASNDASTTKTHVVVRPISQLLNDTTPQGQITRKQLALPLLKAFLQMVFGDNFVHGDLHPGNVLVKTTTTITTTRVRNRDDEEEERGGGMFGWSMAKAQPSNLSFSGREGDNTKTRMETTTTSTQEHTLVFLDAGITTRLSPQGQRNLRDVFLAVVLNDGARVGRLMVERAPWRATCVDVDGGVEAFAQGMQDIVAEFHEGRRSQKKTELTLGAVRIGALLGRVLDLCRMHGVALDPAMGSLVMSTLVLEGLGRSLEPDLNLMDVALPFLVGGVWK